MRSTLNMQMRSTPFSIFQKIVFYPVRFICKTQINSTADNLVKTEYPAFPVFTTIYIPNF